MTFFYSPRSISFSLFSMYYLCLLITCLLLVSCGSTQRSAPVVDRALVDFPNTTGKQGRDKDGFYTVQKGDTLYSIALKYDIDYKALAERNGIVDPSTIRSGQRINLSVSKSQPSLSTLSHDKTTTPILAVPKINNIKSGPKAFKLPYSDEAVAQLKRSGYPYPITQIVNKPVATTQTEAFSRIEAAPSPVPTVTNNTNLNKSSNTAKWMWPTTGKLLTSFSTDSKGIKISGKLGQPVLASAGGKVVYSGDGLRGYGKLIIIKHNSVFLSAYAHNDKILVQEAETVSKGQKIAEMGNTDANSVKLHFEIRKYGKPVDPLKFLPSDSK